LLGKGLGGVKAENYCTTTQNTPNKLTKEGRTMKNNKEKAPPIQKEVES